MTTRDAPPDADHDADAGPTGDARPDTGDGAAPPDIGSDETVPDAEDARAALTVTSPPSGKLGRFTVIGALGSGGMGVVLEAHDPGLDRNVALKLLRPELWEGPAGADARARLQREAQAMAKLAHPNVVTVYEVGTVDDRFFVAMELVNGQTLGAWLREEKRTWRASVAAFLAAGRGLEAAHAAGLVHRDFKPENVLVGRDGRVRVSDFGLVRVVAEADLPAGGGDSPKGDLTAGGAIMGTLAYMSPEQLAGRPSDARSDQFAFCVALHEALYGERPFAGGNLVELRAAIAAEKVRPAPRGATAPAWLRPIVARGLRADPAARWPSMTELLGALERDPGAFRRRAAIAGAAVVLGALGIYGAVRPSAAAEVCAHPEARLAGAWDAATRARVHDAFVATKQPYAQDTFDRVAARLDRYAASWAEMNGEACRATRVDGRQSDTLLDLRVECLDRRRGALAALTHLWSESADAAAVENAIGAADALAPISDCADTPALREHIPRPKDPAAAARIDAARARLDEGDALRQASRLAEARPVIEAARKDADATGFAPLQAQAAFVAGEVYELLDDSAAAEPALLDAARLAGTAHDDALAANALTRLVQVLGQDKARFDEAMLTSRTAEGLVERAGDPPVLRAHLLAQQGKTLEIMAKYPEAKERLTRAEALYTKALGPEATETVEVVVDLGSLAESAGDLAQARALDERALAITERNFGPDHPRLSAMLNNLAMVEDGLGDYAAARAHYERALAIKERAFGPDSPQLANGLSNLANVLSEQGEYDKAGPMYERAIAIREKSLGPDHPYVATTIGNLASLRRHQRRFDEALSLGQRALAIKIKAYGPDHPRVANSLESIAALDRDKGDFAAARELLERSIAIRKKAQGPDHEDTLSAQMSLGETLTEMGRCKDARPLFEAARAGTEKALGADHPALAEALSGIANCDVAEHRARDAVPLLVRALAIVDKADVAPASRGSTRVDLANAYLAAGDAARARTMAAAAEKQLAAAGPDGEADLARARALLAAH